MKRLAMVLLASTLWSMAIPADAQFFFTKRVRANPSQRVPELILTLKTDADERKRRTSAEELADFEIRNYGEIVAVLADVAQNDADISVRLEAIKSLTRIRPITQLAGQALENASQHDENWRVRLNAKSSLVKYYFAGYSSQTPNVGGATEPPITETVTPAAPIASLPIQNAVAPKQRVDIVPIPSTAETMPARTQFQPTSFPRRLPPGGAATSPTADESPLPRQRPEF